MNKLFLLILVCLIAFRPAIGGQFFGETTSIGNGGTGQSTASAAMDALNQVAETTVASATTTDLGAVASQKVSITGTTTITGFGTVAAGTRRQGRFTGALTLTHNATSLILPGSANITTVAGDSFEAISLGAGNWAVYFYQKATWTGTGSEVKATNPTLVGATMTGNLIFSADNTYDIGANGATRPRSAYFANSVTVGQQFIGRAGAKWDSGSSTTWTAQTGAGANAGVTVGTLTVTPATDTTALTVSGISVTGSGATTGINVSGTFNSSGSPIFKVNNVTNTASGASAAIEDWQVSGSSKFKVTLAGVKVGGGTEMKGILSATATLDFPNTLAQTDSDLTVTVTGAAVGDVVSIGVPNGSTQTGSSYSGWVSAADTVTVRFSVYGIAAKDPASGTFRVQVNQF